MDKSDIMLLLLKVNVSEWKPTQCTSNLRRQLCAQGNRGGKWGGKRDGVETSDNTNDNNEGKEDFRWGSWPSGDYTCWDVYSSRLSFMIVSWAGWRWSFVVTCISSLFAFDVFPRPSCLRAGGWGGADLPPAVPGSFSDLTGQWMFSGTGRDL